MRRCGDEDGFAGRGDANGGDLGLNFDEIYS